MSFDNTNLPSVGGGGGWTYKGERTASFPSLPVGPSACVLPAPRQSMERHPIDLAHGCHQDTSVPRSRLGISDVSDDVFVVRCGGPEFVFRID